MPGQQKIKKKRRPFNTGDCLIEVTTCAGLPVYHIRIVDSIFCLFHFVGSRKIKSYALS